MGTYHLLTLFGVVVLLVVACGGGAVPEGTPVAQGVSLSAMWGEEGTGEGQFRVPRRISRWPVRATSTLSKTATLECRFSPVRVSS